MADPTEDQVTDDTVRADEADAAAAHDADRPPTPEEEAAAPTEVDPQVAEAYEAAMERGAAVKGEGQID
ncbi:MAG: hypothetical protein JNK12_17600 [Acidimicrobiales bacterium]|nr:hypothetical protein [Acidimicrobiales bacterium]